VKIFKGAESKSNLLANNMVYLILVVIVCSLFFLSLLYIFAVVFKETFLVSQV